MNKLKFGACEYNFPIWGALALEMAHDAGYDGIEITDGGGYLQPHPMNKGYFVEVERLQPNLIRMDNYPLLDPIVQDEYLEARANTGIEITGINLYFLNCQGFVSSSNDSLTGKDALKTIENAIIAASRMGIPLVTVPTKGMFGVAKNLYALQKLGFAVQVGAEYGVRIANSFDTSLARELEVIEKLNGKLKADFNTIDPAFYAQEPAADMIRALGKNAIEQVKIKDVIADREGFLVKETAGDALLGQGDSDWKACAAAIREVGFEGWILSDTPFNSLALNQNGNDYVGLAARDLKTLKAAFCE